MSSIRASFSIFHWRPSLYISVERTFFELSQLVRVSSLAIMTILIPYSIDPRLFGITFKGLGLSDEFVYAMDLRAFGVGPRTWLEVLKRDFKDRLLIWFSVIMLIVSILLATRG